ncbi:hypothetical protein EVAR_53259_1 [Eumeta japonica]|uniref:Uncharacterized protein n=1 Tax=Eumeta variegata TaxID=151549 RepID=A0A4C1YM32_EUMVA|nr:hypothetical protein EVAR_53259_1 [Eumeta japonica]
MQSQIHLEGSVLRGFNEFQENIRRQISMSISGSTSYQTVSVCNGFVFVMAMHDEIRKVSCSFFLGVIECQYEHASHAHKHSRLRRNPRSHQCVAGLLPWNRIFDEEAMRLVEGSCGLKEVEWAIGALTHWTKDNSCNCYFTSVFSVRQEGLLCDNTMFLTCSHGCERNRKNVLDSPKPKLYSDISLVQIGTVTSAENANCKRAGEQIRKSRPADIQIETGTKYFVWILYSRALPNKGIKAVGKGGVRIFNLPRNALANPPVYIYIFIIVSGPTQTTLKGTALEGINFSMVNGFD